MNAPHSPLFWSFSLGTLFDTRIRVSVWFPLLLIALLLRFDPQVAIALTAIFFVSVLLHELVGHVLVARRTGGDGSEVLLWPIGGLAWVQPAHTQQSQFLTPAGGPFVNFLLCVLTLTPVLMVPGGTNAFFPFTLPFNEFSTNWGSELLILTFFVNWGLMLLNLLPIYPLDGARMMEAALIGRGSGMERKNICLKTGTVVAVILSIIGIWVDNVWVVMLASTLLIMNILEGISLHMGESYDDSFMGYDFSQGYTSLEREDGVAKPPRKSFFERRREKREAAKLKQQQELRQKEEAQLDILLAKVHNEGVDSLTAQEKKFLERTSKNFRTKNG